MPYLRKLSPLILQFDDVVQVMPHFSWLSSKVKYVQELDDMILFGGSLNFPCDYDFHFLIAGFGFAHCNSNS